MPEWRENNQGLKMEQCKRRKHFNSKGAIHNRCAEGDSGCYLFVLTE